MPDDALTVAGLGVRFGGVHALQDVSIAIEAGSVHGLLGPNGSGKTTLLNAVCGFVHAQGDVRLFGESLTHRPAHDRARRGLRRTFQNPKLVQHLTVMELLRMGEHSRHVRAWWRVALLPLQDRRARIQSELRAEDTLELLGLEKGLLGVPVHELSQGMLKMVDIARALIADPQVLLLDEPSSGMSEEEIVGLRTRLSALAGIGTTLVLVEHNLGLIRAVCEQVSVLNLGVLVASGSTEDILARPDVADAFLGTNREVPAA